MLMHRFFWQKQNQNQQLSTYEHTQSIPNRLKTKATTC